MKKKTLLIGILSVLLLIVFITCLFIGKPKDKKDYLRYITLINDKILLDKQVEPNDKVDIYIKTNLLSKEEQNLPLIKNVSVHGYYDNPKQLHLNIYDNYIYGLLITLESIENTTIEIKKSNSKKNEEVNQNLNEKFKKTYENISNKEQRIYGKALEINDDNIIVETPEYKAIIHASKNYDIKLGQILQINFNAKEESNPPHIYATDIILID